MSVLTTFDLDGTLLTKNSSFAFCCYLYRKKVFSLSHFFYCIFWYVRFSCGKMSLENLQKCVFNRFFQGKNISLFLPLIEKFLDESLEGMLYDPVYQRLKKSLDKEPVWILSSSPDFIVKAIARRLGVKNILASQYHLDNENCLQGVKCLVDGKRKKHFLQEAAFDKTIAYSDALLDLPYLEAADQAIVVRPQRRLRKIARKRGWEVL